MYVYFGHFNLTFRCSNKVVLPLELKLILQTNSDHQTTCEFAIFKCIGVQISNFC